jgi:hypothetical protein
MAGDLPEVAQLKQYWVRNPGEAVLSLELWEPTEVWVHFQLVAEARRAKSPGLRDRESVCLRLYRFYRPSSAAWAFLQPVCLLVAAALHVILRPHLHRCCSSLSIRSVVEELSLLVVAWEPFLELEVRSPS